MKGIYFASFYFRVWDLTREIRENKNPAKISTYTVIQNQNYKEITLRAVIIIQFSHVQQRTLLVTNSSEFWQGKFVWVS